MCSSIYMVLSRNQMTSLALTASIAALLQSWTQRCGVVPSLFHENLNTLWKVTNILHQIFAATNIYAEYPFATGQIWLVYLKAMLPGIQFCLHANSSTHKLYILSNNGHNFETVIVFRPELFNFCCFIFSMFFQSILMSSHTCSVVQQQYAWPHCSESIISVATSVSSNILVTFCFRSFQLFPLFVSTRFFLLRALQNAAVFLLLVS